VINPDPVGSVVEFTVSAPDTARTVDRAAKRTTGRLATGVACGTLDGSS
jgi:hypothetical protein